MGLLSKLFGRSGGAGFGMDELARRLGIEEDRLLAVEPQYQEFTIPKRGGGGVRRILAPAPELKRVQRLILRRVLGRLVSHPAATAYERGQSIVTNARLHVKREAVIHLDIQEFFASTRAARIEAFFRKIGWSADAAQHLTRLTTWQGGLPQGAPTSPRLSNLVNFIIDTRLDHLATRLGAMYSRYSDDITFSYSKEDRAAQQCIVLTKEILGEYGYRLHTKRKLSVRRPHQQQRVTGLVVNERINLPREVRRRLRAIEHAAATGRSPSLTPSQLEGWRALVRMIDVQRA